MSIWRPVIPSGPPQPQPQQRITIIVFILATMVAPAAQQWHKDGLEEVKCPSFLDYVPPCTCEASTDGLDFKCSPVDGRRPANFADVSAILSAARFLVKTLSITDLDANATVLPAKTFANGSVAELSIDGSMLRDLDDHAFEGATLRLQSLLLKNGRLTTVPRAVAKVASLKRLDLRSNLIAEVLAYTFFGASKLSYLDLRDNALTSMAENAFLGLENNLRDLVLRENNFQFFPLSAVKILKKLQSLDLADNLINNITSESFIKLDSIKYMDLSSNRFTRIDRNAFASFPRLQKLSLKSNQISEMATGSLDGLHDLETIDISQNSLRRLPESVFAHTRRLTRVDLSHNQLQSLSGVFVDLYALEELLLNDNLLLTLTDDWFRNAPNLRVIHLENNVIFDIDENALQPLKRLAHLHLSFNFLNDIRNSMFRYNVALTLLNLDHNHITVIDPHAFRGVPKLRELRLQNNSLRKITREHFASLTSLTELYLQNNRIAEIETQAFSGLAQLQYLDLRNNRLPKLEDIMMRYPSTLSALYLDDNRLTSFHRETFSGQTTVELLSMANNRLERVPINVFNELINLFRLTLANNRIITIDDNALIGLHQVRYLDVSYNRLVRLTNGTLRGLQQAEKVDLSNNKIATIQSEAFTGFHHLKELDLSYNKLKMIKTGAFRGCLTLHTLKLRGAGVSLIQPNAFDDFVALKILDLAENRLTVPDSLFRLSAMPGLTTLILSGNDLSNITTGAKRLASKNITLFSSFGSLPQLENLEIEDCNLGNITADLLVDNPKLTMIKLGSNNFTVLGKGIFAKQVFLRELHLDGNMFSSAPGDALQYLFNLITLNLSSNYIMELTESSLDHIGSLQILDLSNNAMDSISERAFHNVTKLTSLSLQTNSIRNFPTRTLLPLVDLEHLCVNDNQLQHIPIAVQGLRKVRTLNLSQNHMERLKEIPESRAVMLTVESVILTHTNLTTIGPNDLDLFPNITELTMSSNCLSRIAPYAFQSLNKLIRLDLSWNQIMHLSRERLIGLTSLKTLNLSHNLLGSLDAFPPDLQPLLVLDVSHNRLRSIARDSLTNLPNLVRLDLRGNLLSELMPEVLMPLKKVRAVDLASNQFSTLPLEGISAVEDTLESVHLEGNPLVCSCTSYTQKIWLRQHRKWLDAERRGSKIGPQCHEPTPISDRYLLTVKDSELCPLPSVNSLQLSHITPNAFLVTWDSPDTNLTGLKGFIVAYHRLDKNDQVRKYRVAPTVRGFHVGELADNTLYLVCVITRGSSYTRSPNEIVTTTSRKQQVTYTMVSDYETYSDSEEETSASSRETRDTKEDDAIMFADSVGGISDQIVLIADVNETLSSTEIPLVYPSSNDSSLLVLRPTIVNLGSQSSKCTEIRTPQDPDKISMIDNKKMSIGIGVIGGLVVFALIILIIVVKPNTKDTEEGPDESLAIGAPKTGQNEVPLIFTGPAIVSRSGGPFGSSTPAAPAHTTVPSVRHSRANSVSSVHKISVADGPDMGTGKLKKNQHSGSRNALERTPNGRSGQAAESGTLRRNRTGGDAGSQQQLQKQQSHSSGDRSAGTRTIISKQSSTESGPSSSNRLSRQSSSDTLTPAAARKQHSRHNSESYGGPNGPINPPGGQSWQGTPRNDVRRSGTPLEQTTSLPRRFHQTNSLDGNSVKRRGGASGDQASIPLIEYHLVDKDSPRQPPHSRWSGGARPKTEMRRSIYGDVNHHHIIESGESEGADYFPDESPRPGTRMAKPMMGSGPSNRPYIKYNSFANY